MSDEAAVLKTTLDQIGVEQAEMVRLFGGDLQPVTVVVGWHAAKPIARIECQVSGVVFNVGDGMDQCGTAFWCCRASLGNGERTHSLQCSGKSGRCDGQCGPIRIEVDGLRQPGMHERIRERLLFL